MGYECICGSSIGYRGHYCEGMQKRAAQEQIRLLNLIANSLVTLVALEANVPIPELEPVYEITGESE